MNQKEAKWGFVSGSEAVYCTVTTVSPGRRESDRALEGRHQHGSSTQLVAAPEAAGQIVRIACKRFSFLNGTRHPHHSEEQYGPVFGQGCRFYQWRWRLGSDAGHPAGDPGTTQPLVPPSPRG